MKAKRFHAPLFVAMLVASQQGWADEAMDPGKEFGGQAQSLGKNAAIPKAASTQSIASRATVSSTATVYGGFQLTAAANVFILVRGNSLGSLGVTFNFLDAPRVRIYNSQGIDLVTDGTGRAGFNSCVSTNTTTDLPIINYYQSVGIPVQPRDGCIAGRFSAGVYTFSVTPSTPGVTTTSTSSSPSFGEILFEVILGP
jgi:hypothetical protein